MKKKVMRVLLTAGLLAAAALGTAGCSKKTECALCGQVKNCSEKEYFGEKVYVCGDCAKGLDALDSLGGMLGM
ncbi:MAG TPA: hypothetical protein IAB71_06590 [Candidatus Scatomonas pullistercoris]|uniref:Uncharacterized protein n=1 Tax=Candidatus Scatomonas pullistercoris TaxID=2840920 RepID=A0A9D1P2R3_9FIRM|nr:hypothetical protein [Candidatus Scatomonas pullistercoris]